MSSAEPVEIKAQPSSLHQRILAELERKILSGQWPPGHRIPFEHELTAQYQCSRMTVNKVMTQLAAAGLIERRRRAGSFVTRPHSQSAVLQIQELETEVAALGLPHRFEILKRRLRRTPRDRQGWPDFNETGPLLQLDCRHLAGPQPFCLEKRFINLAVVPEAEGESFDAVPPGTWLVRRVPWSTAEHRIRAVGADPLTAAQLRIPEATPCLVVERRTWSGERPVTFVQLTYPGSAHELMARFSPNQA